MAFKAPGFLQRAINSNEPAPCIHTHMHRMRTHTATPTLCGATGSECSVARLIIVITRDERELSEGTPLTGILKHNIQLLLQLGSFAFLSPRSMWYAAYICSSGCMRCTLNPLCTALCSPLLHKHTKWKQPIPLPPRSLVTPRNNVCIDLCGQSAVLVSLQRALCRPSNLHIRIHTYGRNTCETLRVPLDSVGL